MTIGESIIALVGGTAWVFGIAIAKGFWLTTLAVLVPPVAWVIVAMEIVK